MLQKLKKTKLLLYICLAMFLLNSCTEEREYIENNNRDLKFEQKPFKDLILLKDFNNAYQRVKTEKQKNVASRSALEDEYNFTIKESEKVKIVEVDNKKFYNILIERDSTSASYFENLVFMVEKINNVDEISAYILKYGTPNGYMQFDYNADKDVTPLFERISQECYKVCVTQCHDLREGTIYAEPHAPGAGCNDQSLIVTNCYSTCDSTAGTQFGMGNTTTNGSLTGGDTQNTGSGSNGSTEIVTAPVTGGTLTDGEEKTPCNVLKKKTNDPIYKSKFLALNNPTNFGLPIETGFNEIKTAGVSTYPDAFPLPGGTSMNVHEDAINFTHVHNNKPTTDEDGVPFDEAVKMLSPGDIRVLINRCTYNASLAGGSPLDSFATMISNEGIFSLNIINPNFSTIEQGNFNEKFKKIEKYYLGEVREIIENNKSSTPAAILKRKEQMQIMMLKLIKEYGLENNIALYEAQVVSIGTTKVIKWSQKTINNSGVLGAIPCPQ